MKRTPEDHRACSVPGCTRPFYGRLLCKMHYDRWRRHGEPLVDKRVGTIEDFWSRVDKTSSPHGCHLWTGGVASTGYGQSGKKMFGCRQAHRIAYQLIHGPLPKSVMVCHNCPGGDNKLCVNDQHMYEGNHKLNALDASRKGQLLGRAKPWSKVNARRNKDVLDSI